MIHPITIDAILLDMDGVIVDSETTYFNAVRDAFQEFGVQLSVEKYIQHWMLSKTNVAGAVKDYSLQEHEDAIRTRKRELVTQYLTQGVPLMDYAYELIASLADNHTLGIVTSEKREMMNLKLKPHNLRSNFKETVTSEDVENHKPHPEPYILAAHRLGFQPRNCIAIEDTPSGCESASLAGCTVIAYPNGFTKEMEFPYAHHIVKSLRDVEPLLDRLRQS